MTTMTCGVCRYGDTRQRYGESQHHPLFLDACLMREIGQVWPEQMQWVTSRASDGLWRQCRSGGGRMQWLTMSQGYMVDRGAARQELSMPHIGDAHFDNVSPASEVIKELCVIIFGEELLDRKHKRQHAPPPNQRCGTTWGDANKKCGKACPHDTSEECPDGEDCSSELSTRPCVALERCNSKLKSLCAQELRSNGACSVCQMKTPPSGCSKAILASYCGPQTCEWWQNRHFSAHQVVQAYRHFSYAGQCIRHGSVCRHGTIIPGETVNNQLPDSGRTCAAAGFDCCVKVFPNEQLVSLAGSTLLRPIIRHAHCAVMDTDGLRPPYVHFDDDHRKETALERNGVSLDATIHAYAVIPCKDERSRRNPKGLITLGEKSDPLTYTLCMYVQLPSLFLGLGCTTYELFVFI